MARIMPCVSLAACLLAVPCHGASSSVEIFPALRKRLRAKQELSLEQNASDSNVQMPAIEVPQPMDAGADGFPVLPPVDQILGGAALTLKGVNSQASDIASRMAAAQKQSETELARQKNAFEQNLKMQEMKNQAVVTQNKRISTEIDSLKKGNSDLRKQAHETQKTNVLLRSAVHSLDTKMGKAMEFAHKSMADTDDSKAPVLDVLQGRHHASADLSEAHSTQDDDKEEGDEDDSLDDEYDDVAFLQVSSTVNQAAKDGAVTDAVDTGALDLEAALPDLDLTQQGSSLDSPDALLGTLSRDIASLVQQRKQSVTSLKDLFIRDYRAGSRRHLALMNQQKILSAHRAELLTLQAKLKEAVAHLEDTHKQLKQRLHSLGQFLQKLAHVANAPEKEMPHMLEHLPDAVNFASKVAI